MAKILIVDDEKNVRSVLIRILEQEKYECIEVASVSEAKQYLKEHEFALVFSDMKMPGETGLDLIKYIRKNYSFLPVIMATIVNDPKFAHEALQYGIYGYITKPFDPNQVLIQLYNALHRNELEKQNHEYQENLERLVEKRTRKLDKTIKKLVSVQQTLRNSEFKFRSITTYAKDGIVMIDQDGHVTYWNQAAEKIFGYSSEEVIGKYLHSFIAPAQYEKTYTNGLNKFKHTGEGDVIGQTIELTALKKNGSQFPVELSVSTAKIDNNWSSIGVIRDISERKRSEKIAKRRAIYASLIYNVGQRFSYKLNMDDLLREVVVSIHETFDYFGVMIFIWDETIQKFLLKQITGGFEAIFPKDLAFDYNEGMIGRAAKTAKTQIAADVTKNVHYVRLSGEKTKSELCVPIKYKDKVIGVLDLQSLDYKTFDDLDVEAMETLCMQITIEIKNTQLFENMQNEILERKIAQKELLVSEKKYRTLIETMTDGVGITDLSENLIYVNEACEKLFGYGSDKLVGKNLKELIPKEHFSTILQQTEKRKKGLKSVYEIPLRTKQNEIRSYIISASPFLNHVGELIGTLGIWHDITDRKKMEEKLRESEMRTKKIFESVQAGIVIIDANTKKIIDINSTALSLIGAEKTDVIGSPYKDYFSSLHGQTYSLPDTDESIQHMECQILRSDGEIIPIIKNIVQIDINNQQMFVESFIDVRKLKETEKALSQAQKLESIGQLAAGIAHEINTPMQYIGDNTKFFREAFEDINLFIEKYKSLKNGTNGNGENQAILHSLNDVSQEIDLDYLIEEIPNSIVETLEGVDRVTKIVRSMKEFSHPGSTEKSFVDINHAIESTITVCRNEWKYVAEMETKFDATLPMVNCLPAEMNQVFLNIIINGAHAIRDVVGESRGKKGKITIETHNREKFAQIRICDTGCGIPENIHNRIFDPFFTTKEVGKGTGQGLYIAHDIVVNKHQGNLSFESEIGKGTTFIIELPIAMIMDENLLMEDI